MLYFLHVPKTGGTTVRQALIASTSVFKIDLNRTDAYDYAARLSKLKNENVIVGMFPYGIHEIVGGDYEYVTVLRHPATRVVSDFNYAKLSVSLGLIHISRPFCNGSLEEYVETAWGVQNLATRQLCGKGVLYRGEITEKDFELALGNLKTFKHIGITECLEGFWDKLKDDYDFNLVNPGRKNVRGNTKLKSMRQGVVDHILKYNEWDLKLYEYAKSVA